MWVRRRHRKRTAAAAYRATSQLNRLFVGDRPSPQLAVDLFAGEWSSIMPTAIGVETGGRTPLFDDPRVAWAIAALGGMEGKRVLELGPLEGGHSYMLERHGAAEVVAVEANSHAYLRCLVAKEITRLTRTRFLLGDFVEFLRTTAERFDAVLAVGVLYHMQDPVDLIDLIGRVSTGVAIWTHYFDPQLTERSRPVHKHFSGSTEVREYKGEAFTLHRYDYAEALDWSGFCGGTRPWASWVSLDDLMRVIALAGFSKTEIESVQEDHPNGPAVTFVARREPTGSA